MNVDSLDIEQFDIETLRDFTAMLIRVLDSRLHRRVHLGEEIWVKGSLSQALHLPEILKQLHSKQLKRQQAAIQQLASVWYSLSLRTRLKVAERMHWYDPKTLQWDDPRSNRMPR